MSFADIPLMNVMKAKLEFLSARQGVLAQNVASADIPNYKARDVSAPDFKKMAFGGQEKLSGGLKMATTRGNHIAVNSLSAGGGDIITRASTYELNPNGNNISIEEEMAKIADNQAEYQKVLNLYTSTINLFKTAIGKNGG